VCTCIHFLDRACVHIQNLCVCWICTWRQRQHEIGQTKFKTYFLLDRGGHRTGHRTVAPWNPPFGLESKNLEGGRSQVGPEQQFQSGSSKFLKREDNSGDLLGTFWQEKSVNDRAKGHLLQSIAWYQLSYAKLLTLWGIHENDECRLCKRQQPGETTWPESLVHI